MVFHHILRTVLRGVAQKKVREAVTEAAAQRVGSTQQAPPPEVALLFALGIESGGFEDLLSDLVTTRGDGFVVHRGNIGQRRVAAVISGAGPKAAARATEAVITGHQPKWIISAGFAGGLDPKLRRQDVLMADGVTDSRGNRLTIDVHIDPAAMAKTPGVHVGRLLSGDTVIRMPREKHAAGKRHEAVAVDMETFAVAEVCSRRGVRFLSVRVITDTADESLPKEVEGLLTQKSGPARLGAAAGAILRRPSSLADMYRLKENALVCSDRLARFLAGTIEQL
ncbi:MAG: hypothetical protein V3V75_04045 [Thermoguttaceae bacterium]